MKGKGFVIKFLTGMFLVLIFLPGCSADSEKITEGIDLSGEWKIIETDNTANASLSFDDSIYPDIPIPGNWLDILKKNDDLAATVWIRKKVFIDIDHSFKQPLLFVERIGVADEAYFNGVRIGSSGIIPASVSDLHYQISWNIPRVYFIPENLVRYGADNVVAIKIYSHIQSGVMGEVGLYDYYIDYFRHSFRGYLPVFVNVSAVVLNLMLIFIFMLLYLSERKKTEYLYFSLIILCTLLCSFLTFTLPFMIDGLVRYKLGLALYTLTNFFVFLGVKQFLGFKNRIFVFTAIGLLIISETAALLAPGSRFLVLYSANVCFAFVLLCILSSLGISFWAAKKDPRRYFSFMLIATLITVSVMRNSYYIFSSRFNELPMAIFMHVPLVFMFITLFYLYDSEKSRKEKDKIYVALLKKTKSNIRLLQSLKDKNKKPEPREMITNVIEYLDANYAEKYDRIELSKKFGLNEDYMGQIFKKATGTNISNYINTNRINAVKELLEETNAKIIDIAYHVGFDNLTHFHRQFKIQTGCTPSEYRVNMAPKGENQN